MRRLVLSLLIALFGLAAVLNGVHASNMAAGMVMAGHGAGAPPCDGCGEGDGELAGCVATCVPASALPSSPRFQIDRLGETSPRSAFHWAERLSGPPDPYPPRS